MGMIWGKDLSGLAVYTAPHCIYTALRSGFLKALYLPEKTLMSMSSCIRLANEVRPRKINVLFQVLAHVQI